VIGTREMSARLVPLVVAAIVSVGCTGVPAAGKPLPTIGSSSIETTPGAALLELVRTEAAGKPIERHDGMALIDVGTGERGPTVLTVQIGVDSRSCPQPQAPQLIPDHLLFPAEQRRPAGVWERWRPDHALQQAARQDALPIGDLDDYEFGYAAGSVSGKAVIDVLATPDAEHTGRSDFPGVVVRVDPNAAAGPTVTTVAAG